MNWKFWKEPTEALPAPPPSPEEAIYHKWNQEIVRTILPALAIAIVLWANFIMRILIYDFFGALFPLPIVIPMTVAGFLLLRQHFRNQYMPYPTWDLTVWETLGTRFRDYFSVMNIEPIAWDADLAKKALGCLRDLRRKKYAQEEETKTAQDTKAAKGKGKDPLPALEDTITEGAKELATKHLQFNLVTFGFRKADYPYRQIETVTDGDLSLHMNPVPDHVYVGAVGVDKPCSRLSVVRIGAGMHQVPVVLFVESKENIKRVLSQDRMLANVPEMLVEAKRSHDILLSKATVEENIDLKQQIESLKDIIDKLRKGGYPLTDHLLRIAREYGKPIKPLLTKRQLKWLAMAIGLTILGVVAAAVVLNLIHLLFAGMVLGPAPRAEWLALLGASALPPKEVEVNAA
jgi:hypothetical protein